MFSHDYSGGVTNESGVSFFVDGRKMGEKGGADGMDRMYNRSGCTVVSGESKKQGAIRASTEGGEWVGGRETWELPEGCLDGLNFLNVRHRTVSGFFGSGRGAFGREPTVPSYYIL